MGRGRQVSPAPAGLVATGGHRHGWWGWRTVRHPAFLLLPPLLFLAVFFLAPLGHMVVRSLTDPSPANYARVLSSPVYPFALFTTIWMSAVVTAATLLLGYPFAYATHRAGGALRLALLLLVLLPFWSSLLVRSYAWTVLLRDSGIINWLLMQSGLTDAPLGLIGNKFAVIVGMTHILLPFMVLPILASLDRVEPNLLLAASGLGARPMRTFWRVTLPLTLSGVLAGSLLVFVLAIGFYITPAILGGRTAFFSMLIVMATNQLLDFRFGSALGVILLVCVLLILFVGSRFVRLGDLFGGSRNA